MRIAIGTWETPPSLGGPAYYIDELIKRLSDYVEVVLLVPSHSAVKEKNGLTIKKIATLDIPIARVCMFSAKASFLVKKLDVDVVHDNGVLGFSNFHPFIETWHHGTLDERKYLSTSAYYLSSYRELLTLNGLKKADSIIAISSAAKKELIEKYSMSESKIFVAPHGVDTNFFRPLSITDINQRYLKTNDKKFLLYVGNLSSRKNLMSLIIALKILVKKQGNIHLFIAGAGDKNYLYKLAQTLNLTDYLTFLGPVSRETLLELYNMTDYVVLPSYKEGFGMTMLEALACDKPVIMTPVGISDVIKNNKLGVVTGGFTPMNIASAIELAIKTDFQNLRTFVRENFSWSRTVAETLKVYKYTLENY